MFCGCYNTVSVEVLLGFGGGGAVLDVFVLWLIVVLWFLVFLRCCVLLLYVCGYVCCGFWCVNVGSGVGSRSVWWGVVFRLVCVVGATLRFGAVLEVVVGVISGFAWCL